jgi:diguanylate cyclase (GGDEF)-like protein
MYRFENSRRKKIYEIASIVKLLSLLFCGIIFLNIYYSMLDDVVRIDNSGSSIVTISICLGILILIYEVWIFSSKKNAINENVQIKDIIELLIFIFIFSILIFLSGAHISQYKFLFLFIIITSTIQFGMTYGIIVASISSGIILIIDLIAMPYNTVNQHFETDLILVGVFVLTAWLLGYYVKIEKEYREQLANLANIDELTQVYNHRFFQDSLTQHIETAQRQNYPVALLFIDIDYFKNYNDLYGHQAGDRVLSQTAAILKENVRSQDIVARYGGEEFAVILPDTSEQQALAVAERIRGAVEQDSFVGEENQPNGRITVSVGVSCFPDKAKSKTELINSADDALYRAKFFNKNRVETYFSILEELKMDIEKEHIDLVSSIKTLISVINAKDRYTYGHVERVVIFCDLVANKLGLTEEEKKTLKYGAYLHDIGKIEVPKEILNKKMPLTNEEWNILKQHPVNGVEIIKPVASLKDVIPLIMYHHERYDGRGYPEQLNGKNIPYLVRILSVADSFDAMTSNRPYKIRKSYNEAIEELKRCSLTQFDPDIVKAFIEVIAENKDYFDSLK